MAVPAISDVILYTATPITDTDYAFNWTQLIKYLTDGTWDVTFHDVAALGTMSVTGALTAATLAGNGAGLTNLVLSLSGNNKIGSFTRDVSIASGTQAVTGVGFQPSLVVFLSAGPASASWGAGFDNATNRGHIFNAASGTMYQDATYSISYLSIPNSYDGKINSMDADGFTIGWVKGTSPTGTITVHYLAFR